MSSYTPPPSAPAPGIAASDKMTEVFAAESLAPGSVFPTSPHALPVGTRIGEFEVHRLIGEGGFGIVYLCYDQALDRHVALKEYMPSSLATRENATLAIVVKSKHHLETFEAGLKSFLNEARLLAQFDHPSLVKVYRFWQANGTAYMTMPFYEGPTLKQALAALGRPPDEPTLRSWLDPMLDALDEIHRFSCYHRDIAPDNILLTSAGPLLLDFGAARRVIGDMTQALTVVLKPGFAPIEQYGDAASLAQGAWTDLYALASVVYFAITGRPPMSAVDRVMGDKLEPLSHRVVGRYSPALLAAVDTALAVRPQDRPQNVSVFRALMNGPSKEQTTDLHLWSDDDAPTDVGALPSNDSNHRTALPPTNESPSAPHTVRPAVGAAPKAVVAPAEPGLIPKPNNRPAPLSPLAADVLPLEPRHERTILVGRPKAGPATDSADPPRAKPADAAEFGAGLAPLSGRRAGDAAMPPRPPAAPHTVMPSIWPAPATQTTPPSKPSNNTASAHTGPVRWAWWLGGAALLLIVATLLWTWTKPLAPLERSEPSPTPQAVVVPVAPAPTPTTTPATAEAPKTPLSAAPGSTPPVAIAEQAPNPAPPPTPAGIIVAPKQTAPATRPTASTDTTPSRADNDSPLALPRPSPAPARSEALPAPTTPPPPATPSANARCSDIRQRAGLEDLTQEERQFLRTQCR